MISIAPKKLNKTCLLVFYVLLTNVQMDIYSENNGFPPYIGQSGIQNSAWEFLITIAKLSLTPETQAVPSDSGTEINTALLQLVPKYSPPAGSNRSIPLLVDQLVEISIPDRENPRMYDLAVPATLPLIFQPDIGELNKTNTIYVTNDLNEAFTLLIDNTVGRIATTAIQAFDFFHPDPNYQTYNPVDTFPENIGGFRIEAISPGRNIHLVSDTSPHLLPLINWFVRFGRHNGQFRDLHDRWYTMNPELPIIWNIDSFYPEID